MKSSTYNETRDKTYEPKINHERGEIACLFSDKGCRIEFPIEEDYSYTLVIARLLGGERLFTSHVGYPENVDKGLSDFFNGVTILFNGGMYD